MFFPKKILGGREEEEEEAAAVSSEAALPPRVASPPRRRPGSPAVLPGVPDVLQLVVPHVGNGEDEDVLVGVHASPQLQGSGQPGEGGRGAGHRAGPGRAGPHSPRR